MTLIEDEKQTVFWGFSGYKISVLKIFFFTPMEAVETNSPE